MGSATTAEARSTFKSEVLTWVVADSRPSSPTALAFAATPPVMTRPDAARTAAEARPADAVWAPARVLRAARRRSRRVA